MDALQASMNWRQGARYCRGADGPNSYRCGNQKIRQYLRQRVEYSMRCKRLMVGLIAFALGTGQAFAQTASTLVPRIGETAQEFEARQRGIKLTRPSSDIVTIAADRRGHFFLDPILNGRSIRMVVDTGASVVALTYEDAERVGARLSPRTSRCACPPPTGRSRERRFGSRGPHRRPRRRGRRGGGPSQGTPRSEPAGNEFLEAARRLRYFAGTPESAQIGCSAERSAAASADRHRDMQRLRG